MIRLHTWDKMAQKQQFYLKPSTLLKYLVTDDDKTDTLITAKSSEVDLLTTDYDIYAALTSIKPYDNFNLNKLRKLFEVVEIQNYTQLKQIKKPLLKDEDVEKIRSEALEE